MSKDPRMKNENGPNFAGYYKDLVSTLLSESEEAFSPSTENNSQNSFFPEIKNEKLRIPLQEFLVSCNQEANEILDKIFAILHKKSEIGEEITDSFGVSKNDLILVDSNKKRKVHRDIQSMQDNYEISEPVTDSLAELFDKISKMKQDVDELLNVIVDHFRPMSSLEKNQLGRRIKKLPEKSLDRVVEILESRNVFFVPNAKLIPIDLEKQDDVALWRLYYYVETVLRASSD